MLNIFARPCNEDDASAMLFITFFFIRAQNKAVVLINGVHENPKYLNPVSTVPLSEGPYLSSFDGYFNGFNLIYCVI